MRSYRKKKKHILCMSMLTLLSAFSLSACKGMELDNKTEQIEEYSKAQAMILVASERNRYENVYSSDIWTVQVGDDGEAFDKLVVQNVKQYLEKIKLIGLLANEEGITVTSSEKDTIRKLTDEYMNGLTEADLSYIGCTRDDVTKMYTDIYTADKMIKSITDTVDSEISDSEAKVIKIQQIGTTDEMKAKAILKRVKIDGANFNSMAGRYTETDTIERTILKNDDSEDLITRTAFALEEYEISNILFTDGMYYIIKCTDGYAEEDTLKRKERLVSAMNSKAVKDIIEPYQNEHKIQFKERFWNDIDFSEDDGSTTDSFFDIYNETFG